jgi:hypothetical protein
MPAALTKNAEKSAKAILSPWYNKKAATFVAALGQSLWLNYF